jgi:serine protease
MRQILSISKLASAILAVSVIQNIYAFTFTNPDPRYPDQYAINSPKDADMNVTEGWDYFSPSTNEVVVALLDTGIDTTHPDLMKHLWKNPGEVDANGNCFTDKGDHDGNGYENDCYGYNAITKTGINDGIKDANGIIVPPNQGKGNDPWGHGTQMAGTIAATANNGIGIVGTAGIAKNVKIVTCAAWDMTRTLAQLSSIPLTNQNPVAGLPADQVSCGKYFIDLKKGNAQKGIKPVNIAVLNSSGGASYNIAAIPGISGVAKPEFLININTPGVKDMIDALKLHDILLVTSAGNYNWDLDNQIENLISVENKAYYPASFNVDNILTVGATNSSANLWSMFLRRATMY